MVTNVLYPCAVLLSQALCDVSHIGALGLSSVLAHFAYGHIHTALFNCQGTVICGGSYPICGIHYGGSIQITNDSFIPSSSSQREGTKSAMKFKSFQKVYNCLHFTREFRMACTTKKQYTLQISFTDILAGEYDTYRRIRERILAYEGVTFWALREKSAHYICSFTSTLSNSNYIAPHLIATGNAFC